MRQGQKAPESASPIVMIEINLKNTRLFGFNTRSRRKFTAEFKAKVVLEAIKEQKSLSELAEQFELHPNLISIWKREFLDNAAKVFSKGDEIKNTIEEVEKEKEELFKQIGRLKVENDWLKKKVL